jgi:hypothetical protein
MPDSRNRVEANHQQSISVENATGTDINAFGDPAARHITNTGIERLGGTTNLHSTQTALGVGTTTSGNGLIRIASCHSGSYRRCS